MLVKIVTTAVGTLSNAAVLIPAAIVWLLWSHASHHRIVVKKTLLYIVFGLYLCAVFTLVGIPSVFSMTVDLSANFVPFADIISSPVTSVLNVLLFIPLGVMLPVIWEDYRSVSHTVGFGLSLSLCIEILQIFTFRLTDINDIITNTAGTFIGCMLFFLFGRQHMADKSTKGAAGAVLFVVVVLVMSCTLGALLSDTLMGVIIESPLWELIR